MGTSLIPISNHAIAFENRSFEQIADEILSRINQIQFYFMP